jgi:hypothetical protein
MRLHAPNSYNLREKLSKVSGLTPEYSRFQETAAGDFVRSALRAWHAVVLRQCEPLALAGTAGVRRKCIRL